MSSAVLLVDDDERLLEGLSRTLRREPYDVLTATGIDEALAALASRTVSVVVSDEAMPGMRGTDFLARVRAAYPDTVRIIMTGHASVEVAVRSINEGAVYRFLTKPCHASEFALTIRQALQQRELLARSRQLLDTVRRQAIAMDELEHEARGITSVTRDATGAIVIADGPVDVDELLREIKHEIEDADRRLVRRPRPHLDVP
jgi:DNA-binding NtrC family response regulator